MAKVYRFKVQLKYRKGLWRRIEIRGDQTLADFDSEIRSAFDHDSTDHLSEFYQGRVWSSKGYGEIYPDGSGPGGKVRIESMKLAPGTKLEYVYDFGDDIQHQLILEEIAEPEPDAEYPRIVAQNRPRYKYCEECRERDEKTVATWICLDCSNNEQRPIYLCERCMDRSHMDHYAEEMVY